MRITRSKKIKLTEENQFKLKSPIPNAKITKSSTRTTRQHLRNITNPNTDSEPVDKLKKKRKGGDIMRTLARDEVEPQPVTMEEIETDNEPVGKRKYNDVGIEIQTTSSPLKRLKENVLRSEEWPKETEAMGFGEALTVKETGKGIAEEAKNDEENGKDSNKSQEAQLTLDAKAISEIQNDIQRIFSDANNEQNEPHNNSLAEINEQPNTSNVEVNEQPKISNAEPHDQHGTSNVGAHDQHKNSNAEPNERPNSSNAEKDEQRSTSNTKQPESLDAEVDEQPMNSNDETYEQPNTYSTEQTKAVNNETDEQSSTSNSEQPKTHDAKADEQPKTVDAELDEQPKISSTETDEQPNSTNTEQPKTLNAETDEEHCTFNTEADEQPSTSKAALAQLASSAQFKSLRLLRSNTSIAETKNNNETAVNGDLDVKQLPRRSSVSLPDKLLSIISNLYINAAERLKLEFPPRCAEDLEHCHQHHYRAALPQAPDHTQANNLRCALQQQRYVSFVSWSLDMCHRGEFPGEGIFTKIIEIVLSFNSKSSTKSLNNNYLGHFFNKSIELFSIIVRKFPPCWLTLRQFYINFFQTPLDASKLSKKNEPTLKSNNILEILLDLLENILEKCTEEDLQKDGESFELPPKETPAAEVTFANTEEITPKIPTQQSQSQDMTDSILNSECLNIWDWEEHESRLQTFEALQSPSIRLERLFIALELLLQILESDFVMWILHHHKKAKDWIFCDKNRPLIVLVLALSKYSRSTGVVKHIFTLFSISVNKRAKPRHLRILERYISLAVVASNVADLEYSAIGVRYPNLGTETKSLIHEFFVTFKAHNTSHVSSYLDTIEMLRIPYVRSEFIDYFLQLFYFPHNEDMSPKKIAFDISKKRWLKYKPQIELNANDEDLSREQYLQLLLTALKSYCEWHGAMNFFQLLTKDKTISSFKSVTDSIHRWPTKGSGTLMLNRMRKDISKLDQELRMTVRVSKPKVDLPIADICIDQDVVLKYRTDLKFVVILNSIIAKQSEEATDVDFTAWKTFLANFTEK